MFSPSAPEASVTETKTVQPLRACRVELVGRSDLPPTKRQHSTINKGAFARGVATRARNLFMAPTCVCDRCYNLPQRQNVRKCFRQFQCGSSSKLIAWHAVILSSDWQNDFRCLFHRFRFFLVLSSLWPSAHPVQCRPLPAMPLALPSRSRRRQKDERNRWLSHLYGNLQLALLLDE